MSKAELLDDLRDEQQRWEELLAEVGEARMEQPGVAGHWSVKDIIAHLTGWRRRTVARFQAARRGEPDPPPPWPAHLRTDDEINAWIYDLNHHRSLDNVIAESRDVFQQLVAALDAFSEDELAEPSRFPWMEGQPLSAAALFAHFHEEHEPDLRAWLAQEGPVER